MADIDIESSGFSLMFKSILTWMKTHEDFLKIVTEKALNLFFFEGCSQGTIPVKFPKHRRKSSIFIVNKK